MKDYMKHPSNVKINKLCSSKISSMDEKKYEKINKLYAAYKICHHLISKKNHSTSCHYVNSCSTAYNNILAAHSQLDDTKYCKALKDFKIILEGNDLISTTSCDLKISNLLSYPDACDQIFQKAEQVIAPMIEKNGKSEGQVEPEEESDPQSREQKKKDPDESNILPSPVGATLPVTLISSGLGVLLILLSFYKFTPLGHWLRLQTQGFKGISENIDRENYEMKHNNSEYNDGNLEYTAYNISYNSL
ncbi:PIR Superfamily Protein [Plasmodium ovale curtisi]|uniref:PIR Superfamily Protein n=2 Tax=Plasmodium ovale TaxID=36330 RepID=A0A1A8WLY1_PLAOA|nr:PIR Superfamily Protein [Plasmodium ovale curtisi]